MRTQSNYVTTQNYSMPILSSFCLSFLLTRLWQHHASINMDTHNDKPQLSAPGNATAPDAEYRLLVLEASCKEYRCKGDDIATCAHKRYSNTPTYTSFFLDPSKIIPADQCDDWIQISVKKRKGKWYRSSKWRPYGVIEEQAVRSYITNGKVGTLYVVLKKSPAHNLCEDCEVRKEKEKLQEAMRPLAYDSR